MRRKSRFIFGEKIIANTTITTVSVFSLKSYFIVASIDFWENKPSSRDVSNWISDTDIHFYRP